MNDLNKAVLGGTLKFLIAVAAALFLPAWTFNYWQAWTFITVFFASAMIVIVYLMKYDQKLLERRMKTGPNAEKEMGHKMVQLLVLMAFLGILIFSSVDYRYGWSIMPTSMVIAGNILVALGFLVILFTFRENTFASSTIEIHSEQKIISTGLYAHVRHPMYVGGLILFLGIPIALGSVWGIPVITLFLPVMIWRILDEEKFLAKNLLGYTAYLNKVKYRLLPFVW